MLQFPFEDPETVISSREYPIPKKRKLTLADLISFVVYEQWLARGKVRIV